MACQELTKENICGTLKRKRKEGFIMAMDAYVDKLLRSILFHAYTAKNLKDFINHLETVAGQENVAVVKENIAKLKEQGK